MELFCSGYGYRPHYNAVNDHRKRSHSKTLSRVERFENDAFWKRCFLVWTEKTMLSENGDVIKIDTTGRQTTRPWVSRMADTRYHVTSISRQFRGPIYWNAHASSSFENLHWGYKSVFKTDTAFYYPTALRRVQITFKTSTNITRYLYSRFPAIDQSVSLISHTNSVPLCSASHTSIALSLWINIHEIRSHEHTNLACWIINVLLDVCCVVSLRIFTRCLYFDSPYGLAKTRHNSSKYPAILHNKTSNRSFSLSRNKKKNKLKTIQWKKLRNWDIIEDK